MTRRATFMLYGIGGILLVGGVILVLVLRQRNVQETDVYSTSSPVQKSKTSKNPATSEFTPQEQRRREEVLRLEKTLPNDIRETWTPEDRKAMQDPSLRKQPYLTPTSSTSNP